VVGVICQCWRRMVQMVIVGAVGTPIEWHPKYKGKDEKGREA
jgi:hypothetical protein